MPRTVTCWVVEAAYAPGAGERRGPFRDEHLDRLGKLEAGGVLVAAGAFADMSGSLLVLKVENEDSARAIVESDVYWKNEIWTSWTVRRLNLVDF